MIKRIHIRVGNRRKKGLVVGFLLLFFVLLFVLSSSASADSLYWPSDRVFVRKLVRGAPIHGSNGLAFDSQNHLYIASVLGQEIVIMDPRKGKILDRWGPDQGVVGPDDLVFAPDGSLYWTDILSGEVGWRAPDGTVKKQFVAPFINPIAFNEEGRLFVAQAFIDDGLYEIDPALNNPPVLKLYTGDPSNHLNGFDFGPDGLLYAPRDQLTQMVRIDVDTGHVEVLTDQFSGSCMFDSRGDLYVATDDPGLLRFDPETGEVTVITTLPEGSDNLDFDAQGNIYVSNFRDGAIYRVHRNGKIRQISRGGLIAPGGIAALPEGGYKDTLFIADFWTVRAFDGHTGQPGPVGSDFFFDSPFTAAPDGDNLILTSWFGNTLEVWDPQTQSILEYYDGYATPLNAIRFQDDFIVAELGSGNLIRQDGVTGERTVLATLIVPTGLAATEDDLWAADWATGMLWQIVANNEVLDPPTLVTDGLENPEGLALDRYGYLLVVESSAGRLSRVHPATGHVYTVADGLALGIEAPAGWPPTWFFNDVAAGQKGYIYVTGDIDNTIYKIKIRTGRKGS